VLWDDDDAIAHDPLRTVATVTLGNIVTMTFGTSVAIVGFVPSVALMTSSRLTRLYSCNNSRMTRRIFTKFSALVMPLETAPNKKFFILYSQ
jgi:hypothetical protein